MRRGSVYCCIIAAVLLMAVTSTDFGFAQAEQSQPQEQSYRVATVKVNSGMASEWENYLKNEMIPVMKKSGVTAFETWTKLFGDPDEYVMLIPFKSMAELDGPGPFASAGQAGLAALMTKLRPIVSSVRFSIIQSQNSLSIAAKPGYIPKIGVLVTNTVAIGHEADYAKSSRVVMTAAGKTNTKGFLTSRLALGGNANEHYTLILFDAFADLEAFVPAFVKALSEAKLAPESGAVIQRQYEVLKYIPELSIRPSAP